MNAKNDSCFLVASDEAFHFGDSVPIRDGLGAFIFEVEDAAVGESLVEVFYREASERQFDLTIIQRKALTTTELVFAKREVSRAASIGERLNDFEYRVDDPVYRAIGWCASRLAPLEVEVKQVLGEVNGASASAAPTNPFATHRGSLPALPVPQSLKQAMERLVHVLDRHRLVFLFFAGAVRLNPLQISGRTGIRERVFHEDVMGYKQFMDAVDSDGKFLFLNRSFLDRYADEAVSRFGPGEGCKPEVDGASHPYWSMDESGASYMEDSADSILEAVAHLHEFDSDGTFRELGDQAIAAAHDRDTPRWYSCIVTRWAYLHALDMVIADIKRGVARVRKQSNERPSEATVAPPDADADTDTDTDTDTLYFLSVNVDEAMYNHDPMILGQCVGDPNYLPVNNDIYFFYRVSGAEAAGRLLRLFNKGVKPYAESLGETRVRVAFSLTPAADKDDDERFLIEEAIDEARNAVLNQHRTWRAKQGMRIQDGKIVAGHELANQRPPLSPEMLAPSTLYDRAERWFERIEEHRRRREGAINADDTDTPSIGEEEKASDDLLRAILPTAITATVAIRDLRRIRCCFPNAIPRAEAESLHAALQSQLSSSLDVCHLKKILEEPFFPNDGDIDADMKYSAAMGVLALNHPDFKADPSSPEEMSSALDATMRLSQERAIGSVKEIASRLIQTMLYDCRIPTVEGDPSFNEQGRFLQMLQRYWTVVRSVILDAARSLVSMRPHPLMSIIVNYQDRIGTCLTELKDCPGVEDVRRTATSLIEIVLSGSPDDLQVDDDWTFDQVGSVDRFIEDTRLRIGAKTYQLTYPEELSLQQSERALSDYRAQIKKASARLFPPRSANPPPSRASDNRAHSGPASDSPKGTENSDSSASATKPNGTLSTGALNDHHDLELTPTQRLVLRAVHDLGATSETNKVTSPTIAAKVRLDEDSRLRTALSQLRKFRLLGGSKGGVGYWLTDKGARIACGDASPVAVS